MLHARNADAVSGTTRQERRRRLRTWIGISRSTSAWLTQRREASTEAGLSTSWYVFDCQQYYSPLTHLQDWIKSREVDEEHLATAKETAAANELAAAAKNPKLQWIPVPNDPVLAQSVCPICQEKFEMKWLDDAQEWGWIDAVQIGSRVYHATCHAEVKKDGATPEPVLRKRKNQVCFGRDF